MSRAIYLSLDEGVVVIRCLAEKVGISAIERLPGGGVRLAGMARKQTLAASSFFLLS